MPNVMGDLAIGCQGSRGGICTGLPVRTAAQMACHGVALKSIADRHTIAKKEMDRQAVGLHGVVLHT